MFIGIYYPPKDIHITAILLNGCVYWKAADIVIKLLNYTHVGDTLKRYLPNEEFIKYCDLLERYKNTKTIVMSYEQVIVFMINCVREDHLFYRFFTDVNNGNLKLYPVCKTTYQFVLQNPNYNGIVYFTTFREEEEESSDIELTLTELSVQLRLKNEPMSPDSVKHNNNSSMEEPPSDDCEMIIDIVDDVKHNNSSMEEPSNEMIVDKYKSFYYNDVKLNDAYRYVAINTHWPETVPIDIYPYIKYDRETGSTYVYVPVRINNND